MVKSVHNSAPNYLASSGSLNSPRVRDRVGEGKGAPALHSARRYLTEISAPVDRRFPAKLVLHGPFFVPGFSLFLTFTRLLPWCCRQIWSLACLQSGPCCQNKNEFLIKFCHNSRILHRQSHAHLLITAIAVGPLLFLTNAYVHTIHPS